MTMTDRERALILRGTLSTINPGGSTDADASADHADEPNGVQVLGEHDLPRWDSKERGSLAQELALALPFATFCKLMVDRNDPDDFLALVLRRHKAQSLFALRLEHYLPKSSLVVAEALPPHAQIPTMTGCEIPDGYKEDYGFFFETGDDVGRTLDVDALAAYAIQKIDRVIMQIVTSIEILDDPEFLWAVHAMLGKRRQHARDLRDSAVARAAAWRDNIRMTTTLQPPRIKPYRRGD